MPRRRIRLIRQGFPDRPAFNTAVSHAILRRVSAGSEPETLRIHRPPAVVAFAPRDRASEGYGEAVGAAHSHGFAAVERLAGGRAAVFHERTLAFAWAIPDPRPRDRTTARFEEVAGIMARAFGSLGVDARVGEVAGEYCPGAYSVNARGAKKLMGVGQRQLARAAHVGGVVVVGDGARVVDVLVPVYSALDLEWDPKTTGSVEDEIGSVRWDEVEERVLEEFAARYELVEGWVSEEALTLASELEPRHAVSVAVAS